MTTPTNQTIGDRIRQAREAKGWSVEEFAIGSDLYPSDGYIVEMMEAGCDDGEHSLAHLHSVVAMDIARALGVSLDYLLTGEDVAAELRAENDSLKAELKRLRERNEFPLENFRLSSP